MVLMSIEVLLGFASIWQGISINSGFMQLTVGQEVYFIITFIETPDKTPDDWVEHLLSSEKQAHFVLILFGVVLLHCILYSL